MIFTYIGWGRGSCSSKEDPDHRERAWSNSRSSYAGQRKIGRERQGSAKCKSSKHCYVIRQTKKCPSLLPNLFYAQARNKFHLQIYFSLVMKIKYLYDISRWTILTFWYIRKSSVHETLVASIKLFIQRFINMKFGGYIKNHKSWKMQREIFGFHVSHLYSREKNKKYDSTFLYQKIYKQDKTSRLI